MVVVALMVAELWLRWTAKKEIITEFVNILSTDEFLLKINKDLTNSMNRQKHQIIIRQKQIKTSTDCL